MAKTKLEYDDNDEDNISSDDSYLENDSPFVVQKTRWLMIPLPYSDYHILCIIRSRKQLIQLSSEDDTWRNTDNKYVHTY